MSDPSGVDGAPLRGRSWRLGKRGALGLLAVGAAATFLWIAPSLPRTREVDLELTEPATVSGVDVVWTRRGEEAEPARGGTWRFAPGDAPRTLATKISLPDGEFRVEITIHRATGSELVERRLELGDTDHVTIPLH